jgi:hypothetical protein
MVHRDREGSLAPPIINGKRDNGFVEFADYVEIPAENFAGWRHEAVLAHLPIFAEADANIGGCLSVGESRRLDAAWERV